MTREEAKELLPFMQAFAEGKSIQMRTKNRPWFDVLDDKLEIGKIFEYRIKPEPKYRPFRTQEECWNEMHKHTNFGWLKRNNTGRYVHISVISSDGLMFGSKGYNYKAAFECYTFTDGTPFGIKEE